MNPLKILKNLDNSTWKKLALISWKILKYPWQKYIKNSRLKPQVTNTKNQWLYMSEKYLDLLKYMRI